MNQEDEEFERIVKKRQYLIDYILEPPLVSKQKEWVGLTEDQIDELEKEFIGFSVPNIYNFVQAIEAKLKERNT